jgi:hypothetical protein
MSKQFEWYASGNAPTLFPTELFQGLFMFEDLSILKIPIADPFATAWGKPVTKRLTHDKYHPVPKFIVLQWFSIVENKFYAAADELPTEQIELLLSETNKKTRKPLYDTIVAGMAPHGKVALWLCGNGITTEVAWLQGKEIEMSMQDFAPDSNFSQIKYARKALANCKEALMNLQEKGKPTPILFEKYMEKFNYSIAPTFEEGVEFAGIELFYYNGELNTANSGEHTICGMRAKPEKIVLNWRAGKAQYSGYFWTDEQKIIELFDNYYGTEVQKEGKLIIEVGRTNQEIKFFMQNNESSVEIPDNNLQYIIFKNKFEFHRSNNYDKPHGGWRS